MKMMKKDVDIEDFLRIVKKVKVYSIAFSKLPKTPAMSKSPKLSL
jgi:hypothetical protein